MKNYRKVSDETEELFNEVLSRTAIPNWVEFKIASDDSLVNEDGYIVVKQNNLNEWLTEGLQVVIVINEEIFDGLVERDVQWKFLEETIGGIIADQEKGTVKIKKKDFTTHSGFLEKYGADDVLLLKMAVKSLYDKKQQKEDEEKAQAKLDKKKKKN